MQQSSLYSNRAFSIEYSHFSVCLNYLLFESSSEPSALMIDHVCHALAFLHSKVFLYLKDLHSLSEYYHESKIN